MKPILQLALDFLNLKRALKVAEEATKGGVDWLEVGTPLIKSEGLEAIRQLRKKCPLTMVGGTSISCIGSKCMWYVKEKCIFLNLVEKISN